MNNVLLSLKFKCKCLALHFLIISTNWSVTIPAWAHLIFIINNMAV